MSFGRDIAYGVGLQVLKQIVIVALIALVAGLAIGYGISFL